MPQFEWKGLVRITTGELTRKSQLDLWRAYQQAGWDGRELQGEDFIRYLQETDTLVTLASTRLIEICKGGKWVVLQAGKDAAIEIEAGNGFVLANPMTQALFDDLPRSLADGWIQDATELNGGINNSLLFFTSLDVANGKANNAPPSAAAPSSLPTAETTS